MKFPLNIRCIAAAIIILSLFHAPVAIQVDSSDSTSTSTISRFVASADGTQIFAEATGNPRGSHLVLVHGLALAAATLDRLFFDASMTKNFFMVRYDLRGHGQSGKPTTAAGYTSDKWAQDFAAVVSAFKLKDVVYVGWSYGGSVPPDIIANIKPNPLRAIISLAAIPNLGPIRNTVLTDINESLGPGLVATNDSVLSLNTRIAFVDTCFGHPEAVPYTLRSQWVGFSASQTPDITNLVQTRTQDASPFLEAGKAGLPLLIIGGTLDAHINVTILIEEMSQLFVNVESHLIPNEGHAIFYDATSATVGYITEFIQELNLGQ